jgi:hypothetical protein
VELSTSHCFRELLRQRTAATVAALRTMVVCRGALEPPPGPSWNCLINSRKEVAIVFNSLPVSLTNLTPLPTSIDDLPI